MFFSFCRQWNCKWYCKCSSDLIQELQWMNSINVTLAKMYRKIFNTRDEQVYLIHQGLWIWLTTMDQCTWSTKFYEFDSNLWITVLDQLRFMSLKPNCGSMVNIEPYLLLATGHNRAEKWTVIGLCSF